MSNLVKKEKGFTLIEIVLVLAIAGLIMVIVFLALAGAQKNRRDTQRKEDNSRLEAQIESYASNNSGQYPTTAADQSAFASQYMPSNFKDPLSGNNYSSTLVWDVGKAVPNPLTCAQPPGTVAIYINGRQVDSVMTLEQGCSDVKNY